MGIFDPQLLARQHLEQQAAQQQQPSVPVGPPVSQAGGPTGGGLIGRGRLGGLLGDPNALLAIGASLLQQSGPQVRPIGLGQALGTALQAGFATQQALLQQRQAAQQQQLENQRAQAQQALLERQTATGERREDRLGDTPQIIPAGAAIRNPETGAITVPNPARDPIKSEVIALQNRRGALIAAGLGEDSLEVRELTGRITKLNAIIADAGGQNLADPRTQSQIGKEAQEFRDQVRQSSATISRLGEFNRNVRENPGAVAARGVVGETISGIAEQVAPGVGGDIAAQVISGTDEDTLNTVRLQARTLVGPLIRQITTDQSGRYSDKDLEFTNQAFGALKAAKSAAAVNAIAEELITIELSGQIRGAALVGQPSPFNLSSREGINAMGARLLQLGFSEKKAESALRRLMAIHQDPFTG